MPCAKLLATNRPSADDSRAARHIAQPCANAEAQARATATIDEVTVKSFRISAVPNQVRWVAERLRECERKKNHGQDQRSERYQDEIDPLIPQMHKNSRDH